VLDPVESIRNRMRANEPIEGDVSWCKRRLIALEEWPDMLTEEQYMEKLELEDWLRTHA
jgi:hypothetical protein